MAIIETITLLAILFGGAAAGAAGTLALEWVYGFFKNLLERYPEIKEKISEFLDNAKKEIHVIIDKIDNRLYQLDVRGKEKKEILITHRTISLGEMNEMGYQGGDHFEHALTI